MQNKFAWISTPDELWEDKKEMITTALESGIDHVLDFDDIEEIRKLGNVKIIANNDDADIYLAGIRWRLCDGGYPVFRAARYPRDLPRRRIVAADIPGLYLDHQ